MARERKPGKQGAIATVRLQPGTRRDGVAGNVPTAPGAEAMTTQSQAATPTSGHSENSLPVRLNIAGATSIKVAGDMQPKAAKQKTSVALQQRPQTGGLNPTPAEMLLVLDCSKSTDIKLQDTVVADKASELVTSVASLVGEYTELNREINDITESFMDRGAKLEDEANTELLPRYAHMQSLLSPDLCTAFEELKRL